LAATNGVVRREGIQLLAQTSAPVPASVLEKLLGDFKEIRQGQAALSALGESQDRGADEILVRLLDKWLGGQFPPEWRLELLEAAIKRTAPAIIERRERLAKSLVAEGESGTNLVALAGGDATAGRKIFMERPGVECLRCHIIKGQGGTVGPDLSLIGADRSRAALLESILYPNRQISPGYENVTVRTKSGRVLAGMVVSETATVVELASPEEGLVKLERAELVSRNRALSAMPEGLGQFLSQRDLRDLIEFLAGLK
jgi:quinoprotein glucose dehydrogenase